MSGQITGIFLHSFMITLFVFAMMVLTDFINVVSAGKAKEWVSGGKFRQYSVASLLGVSPGCTGAFMNVTLYSHSFIGFGALAAGMIATSGDESFVMLALFPGRALLLFLLLFIVGLASAPLIDWLAVKLNIGYCEECRVKLIHDDVKERYFRNIGDIRSELGQFNFAKYLLLFIVAFLLILFVFQILGEPGWGWERVTMVILLSVLIIIVLASSEHYIEEHIWRHIIIKHIWRVFLWTLGALLFIKIGLVYLDMNSFVRGNPALMILVAALIGLIPESGPHLLFVTMFANGVIPFSVLLTSSIVQDGHGMLPMLSVSLKYSIYVKLFNLVIGLILGYVFLLFGL